MMISRRLNRIFIWKLITIGSILLIFSPAIPAFAMNNSTKKKSSNIGSKIVTTQPFPTNAELENLENLDFNNPIKIDTELLSKIETSLSGFNAGFIESRNNGNELIYRLSTSQMEIQFGIDGITLYKTSYRTFDSVGEIISPHETDPSIDYASISTYSLDFIDGNNVQPYVENPSSNYFNYFYGSNPDNWITNIPTYQKLIYTNLYDNIDVIFSIKDEELNWEFQIFPGGNYEDINLNWFEHLNQQNLKDEIQILDPINNLDISMIIDKIPISVHGTHINKTKNASIVMKNDGSFGFTLDEIDRSINLSQELSINPILEFTTLLGGIYPDIGIAIAIDDIGDIYVTGYTIGSPNTFPTSPDAYDKTQSGSSDMFVTKLAANGSTLIFSTFIGGSDQEDVEAIAIDDVGNVYITGSTSNETGDYPTTQGAYDQTHNGAVDVFVTKLSANGSKLLYSTLIGGSSIDIAHSINVDHMGNAYITGYTKNDTLNFPTTNGAYDVNHNGGSDVFVTKISQDGSSLEFSTFLGGSLDDWGNSLTLNTAGEVFITGKTQDGVNDLPTTGDAYNQNHNGASDVFISKLSSNGTNLLYSTFLGGSNIDSGLSLVIDSMGNIIVTGSAWNSTIPFPTTQSAYNLIHNGKSDVFVTKIAANGSTLIFSTILGGSSFDRGLSIVVDSIDDIYLTGWTDKGNIEFPTTQDAYDRTHNGMLDIFVSKLSSNGSLLMYSTLLGSSEGESGKSIAIDHNDDIFITGTASLHFPVTEGIFDETFNGGTDVFITKFRTNPSVPQPPQSLNIESISQGIIVTWSAPSDDGGYDVDEYKVYRSTLVEDGYTLVNSTHLFEHVDEGLIVDVTYYYKITASNFIGESNYSMIVNANPGDPPGTTTTTLSSISSSNPSTDQSIDSDSGFLFSRFSFLMTGLTIIVIFIVKHQKETESN